MRRYLVPGQVRTVVRCFQVKKGEEDIRVVWDLSKNGLNLVYTPSFFLPTASSYVWRLEPGMEAGDFDIGEQFHNYMLHSSKQPPYCGVDLPSDLVAELLSAGFSVERYMR